MRHLFILLTASAFGCSFNVGHGGDLGVSDDMGTTDGSSGADDLAGGGDMTVICTPDAKTCTGSTLSTCNSDGTGYDTATCSIGCNTMNTACLTMQPTPPAMPSDFVYGGLSDLTISATQSLLIFDTDTGAITDNTGATVRMANPSPDARYVENGIGFHRTNNVGIWTFSNFSLPATATVVFKNPFAASILSPGNISIAGTIDARGYADPTKALMMGASTLCTGNVPGPGGVAGGIGAADMATGFAGEGGQPTGTGAGGGGASYGGIGAAGGNNGGNGTGGGAGAVTGSAAISPLLGGFGGGSSDGAGGGGGGAFQLAAEGTISVSGTINAGGCGGAPGLGTAKGGGGGGSGGAVLVEGVTLHVTASAILAANGGGGGGGGSATATAGDPGNALTPISPANGGGGTGGGHNGGSGEASGSSAGPGNNGNGAGGGGGGVGRIRLNGQSAPTVDVGATISPTQTTGVVVVQ